MKLRKRSARPTSLWSLAVALACAGVGCGDRLAGGDFWGDATIRLHATVTAAKGDPARARVGALWLGYDTIDDPAGGIETTTLPVSAVEFPPSFVCDVVGPPPSAGAYITADHHIVPASIRLARLIVFDDGDADGACALDREGKLAGADVLLARAASHLLLFVERPPDDPVALQEARALLTNWEVATPGYHLLEVEPGALPGEFLWRVVRSDTLIPFTAATGGLAY